MSLAKTFERILNSLAQIPGLRFLQDYVMSAKGMQTRFGQRKGDYESYLQAARNAGGEMGNVAGGSKKKRGAGGTEGADDDDQDGDLDDEQNYDYYDDYEGDSNSELDQSDGKVAYEDDYPASDDQKSYYDDDYR